jgi:hypothetical protein
MQIIKKKLNEKNEQKNTSLEEYTLYFQRSNLIYKTSIKETVLY